ncbi:centromere protein J [Trichogramma pretiosum]|uniref:centromere protein J n=1 Tax=Trichogramma pretiosum TaxID=7493 RepID=UPI0006C9CBC6|nr:centromere protein J [Trichogramma pretiosum]
MAIEASIVEQLHRLRQWQIEEQEKLLQQQQEQREMLSDEQNRRYQALSLSVEEMSLDDEALKDLLTNHKSNNSKNEEDVSLIDFDTPAEALTPSILANGNHCSPYSSLNKENAKVNSANLEVPNMKLTVRNAKTDDKPKIDCDNLINQNNYSSDFSLDESAFLSVSNPGRKSISIDDTPVPPPVKNFQQLLEDKLKDTEAVSMENTPVKNKPVVKRPFLKKGEGLARFMPNANNGIKAQKKCAVKPKSASFTDGTISSNSKITKTSNLGRCNSIPKSKISNPKKSITNNIPPVAQNKLNLKNVTPPIRKARSKFTATKSNAVQTQPSPLDKKKVLQTSSDANSSDIDTKNKRELEEVRVFELLEDKAENSSFCSTSSTVIAFLQQSTPLKAKALLHSASKHKISLDDVGSDTLDEIVQTTKKNYPWLERIRKPVNKQLITVDGNKKSKIDSATQWDNIPLSKIKNDKTIAGTILPYGTDVDLHYDDYSIQETSNLNDTNISLHVRFSEYNEYKTLTDTSSLSSDSQTVINHENENRAWSDCSATPDTSDAESVISKSKNDVNNSEHNGYAENVYTDDDEDDETIDGKYEETENNEDSEAETGTGLVDVTLQTEKKEEIQTIKSELLKQRLQELEHEIEIFRKESASLAAQRLKLGEERTKLQEERIAMQRGIRDKEESLEIEKRKMEGILLEEKKRLSREKAALENRMKDAHDKAQKSKQDRMELQALKDEMEDLKEDFAQRESKWSATSARQRSQIRVLQTENSKLKQEIEKLQQRKANTNKIKRPVASSNTKAIHQINKYLAERKRTSIGRSSEPVYQEEQKPCESVDSQSDLELEHVELEIPQEPEEEDQQKVMKTAESIARTRILYENLLKEATDGLSETQSARKSLTTTPSSHQLNQQAKHSDQIPEENRSAEDLEPTVLVTNLQNSRVVTGEERDENANKTHPAKSNGKQIVREVHHPDGRAEYWYPNGNVKKVFPDTGITKIIYYNGDVREADRNGVVKYFYAATRTWHTTLPDGLEILEFPDGQVERRSKDGTIEVSFADGSARIVQADGSEKWLLRDGTVAETSADGEKILTMPNGQREIHTKDHKRREYPDGTVKFLYPDGVQETRYANGRIRMKDKNGTLIMDTHQ